jgi:hypothetical protein
MFEVGKCSVLRVYEMKANLNQFAFECKLEELDQNDEES